MHRKKNGQGYWLVYIPVHPYADSNHYVREHRLFMEQHLGRYLIKGEDVHHINGNRADNRIENLKLMVHSDHSRIERIGKSPSEETRRRMGLAHIGNTYNKGRKHTEEFKERQRQMMIGNTYSKGRKLSEEHVNKMKCRKISPETRLKLSLAAKGKRLSEEHKEKIRLAHLGKPHPHIGWVPSEGTRLKLSITRKNRIYSSETLNQ